MKIKDSDPELCLKYLLSVAGNYNMDLLIKDNMEKCKIEWPKI